MSVDTGEVLHVLAHELRTPTGIAQGYIRLLLEDRLAEPADRRRAFEQLQHALGRIAELSHQSTALANVLESSRDAARVELPLARLVDRLAEQGASADPPFVVRAEAIAPNHVVRTFDEEALFGALTTIVRATARELRDDSCAVRVVGEGNVADFYVGAKMSGTVLTTGPRAADAGPISLERGGLGLTLVHAVVVLGAHDAECWTVGSARNILGVRLPVCERAHP